MVDVDRMVRWREKMTHTPWVIKGDDSDWDMPSREGAAVCGSASIYDATGEVVAFAVNVGWSDKDSERRDFIVKAVNNHAKLVEALREAVEVVRVAASLAAGRSDDEWIWGVQDKIAAALEGLE